jgi:hypothetical protein
MKTLAISTILWLSLCAAGWAIPQDADVASEDFSTTLAQLQSRVAALEAENAALQSGATLQDAAAAGEAAAAETVVTNGVDDLQHLRMLAEDTSRRLNDLQQELQDNAKQEAEAAEKKKAEDAKKEKKWFEKYTIRGYTQLRFSEVTREDGPAAPHVVSDTSVGNNQSFLIRRARLILSGDISEHVSLYLQPEFAGTVTGSPDQIHYAQLRDIYADIHLDKEKEYRFRAGLSKVPYGWENMQSSSNRLPLDRNDALNSAVRNERDVGLMFYWTPKDAQDFFKTVNDQGLKGSGNYGLFGIGLYNGQGGSLREQNDNLHAVARLTLPFYLNDDQMAEVGIQGYTGRYGVLSSQISPLGAGPLIRPAGTVDNGGPSGLEDKRIAWTFVYYPQPIGFQTEWTVGRGPSLNAEQTALEERALYGGYAMVMYREKLQKGELLPFARWNYYRGGYKSERNAPWADIREWEMGLEWQFSKALELTAAYTITDRTNTSAISQVGARSYEQFEGHFLRAQLQFNY